VVLLTFPSAGQLMAADDIQTIRYTQGKLETDFLPYGRKFAIEGSASLPEGNADVIELRITGPDGDLCYSWQRPSESSDNKFRIVVDALRRLDVEYKMTITFYQRFVPTDRDLRNIVSQSLKKIDSIRKGGLGSLTAITLVTLVQQASTEVLLKKNPTLRFFSTEHCVESTKPAPDITEETIQPLMTLPADTKVMQTRFERADKAKSELEKLDLVKLETLRKHLVTAREEYEKLPADKQQQNPFYTKEDVNSLFAALNQPESSAEVTDPFLTLKSKRSNPDLTGPFGKLSQDDLNQLDSLIQILENISITDEQVKNAERDVNDETGRLIASFKTAIRRVFMQQAINSLQLRTWGDSAEISRLRLGTIYGLSVAALNIALSSRPNRDVEADAFSMIGLKWYLAPVDKSLPEDLKYPTAMSRWAITLAAVVASDLDYRGQPMNALTASIMPALGISYDVHSIFVVNAGVVLFKQPSVNPLSTASYTKVAPYFGLSYDFDVLNVIRNTITRQ
jgi:hypothetical protein